MSYTLAAAATATGLSQTTILRAIRDGRIAGTRDWRGDWRIEETELPFLFPVVADRLDATAPIDVDALGQQIEALLRQVAERLHRHEDEARHDAPVGHGLLSDDAQDLPIIERPARLS
jgi:excisionase family DNA binding protein